MIVLDASALCELVLNTERGRRVARRLAVEGESLHAPQILFLEALEAMRKLELRGEIDPGRAALAVERIAGLVLDAYPHEPLLPRCRELRAGVTTYDAAYLALGELLAAPVVTCDGRLARASGHEAVVECV